MNNLWITAITAPSNSVDPSDLIVIGLNDFQIMVSHTFVAINNEIPDPIPYPDYNISSSMITTNPANANYNTINKAFPFPIYSKVP